MNTWSFYKLEILLGGQLLSSIIKSSWQEWLNTYPASELLLCVQEPLMRVAEPYLVCESLSRLWPDQNMTGHGYRKWVTLKSLIRSEWLLRMAEYAPRMWVALQCLTRSEPLMWTNTHPGSEPLSCLSKSELLMRMAEYAASKLLFSFWADQNHWWTCI